jgi:hypothetical protein
LLETLNRPELAGLRQRLAVRVEVGPLPLQEAADYLLHHVRVAGGRPEQLFADEAVELLARQTGGVPRLLNQAAHQALALAAEAGAAQVDAEAALEALALLGLADEERGAWSGERGAEDNAPPSTLPPPQTPADTPPESAETGDASCRLFLATARAD